MQPPTNIVEAAVKAANLSPCAKSKRGVALFYSAGILTAHLSSGFNGPPRGLACTGDDACHAVCRRRCVHAEVRAIRGIGEIPPYTEAVHVKTVDGVLVAGGPPSCMPCATAVLDAGISAFWLYEARECLVPDCIVTEYWRQREAGNHYPDRVPSREDDDDCAHVHQHRVEWVRYTARDFYDTSLKNSGWKRMWP